MSDNYPQVAKAWVWYFEMVDDTDGYSPEAGLSPTVTISKDGAAFASLTGAPSVTGIATGWYKVTVPAADMADGIILRAVDGTAAARDRWLQMNPGGDWLSRLVGKVTTTRSTGVDSFKKPDGSTEQFKMTPGEVSSDVSAYTPG